MAKGGPKYHSTFDIRHFLIRATMTQVRAHSTRIFLLVLVLVLVLDSSCGCSDYEDEDDDEDEVVAASPRCVHPCSSVVKVPA